ncbi:hypothetical protein NKG05_29575 [Oerskovia sp. M15]
MQNRRKATARDVVLILLAIVAPVLLMRQRRGRGWIVDDVTTAMVLFGVVGLVAALGLAMRVRRADPLVKDRALFVLLAVFTTVGVAFGSWRTFDEGLTVPTALGVLAASLRSRSTCASPSRSVRALRDPCAPLRLTDHLRSVAAMFGLGGPRTVGMAPFPTQR